MSQFVLKNRNFALLFYGRLVSNLGTTIYNFAISLYVLRLAGELTDKPATIAGLYLMTGAGIYFLVAPFAGAIVDRLDKVKVVVITDIIRGILICSAGIIIFSGLSNEVIIIVLFITTAIMGINGALFAPAASSLPPHILEPDQLQQANSLNQGSAALYQILGALGGGIIYQVLPIEWIFIINGVSFLASGVSEMFIQVTTKVIEETRITFRNTVLDIKEGLKYLYKLKPILALVIVASMLNFFTTPVIANGLPYLFQEQLGRSPIYLSYLNVSYLTGVILISIYLASRKQEDKVSPLIKRGYVGMSVMFTLFVLLFYLLMEGNMSFNLFIITSIITLIILGFFNGYLNIPFSTAVMKTVEKEKMGRVFSVISVISNGLTPIAMGLAGIVIDNLGLSILFYAAAVAIIITTILTINNKEIAKL